MRRDVALQEDDRPFRIEPGRKEHRRQAESAPAQLLRVVLDRDRVEVDDAEQRLALLLRRRVLAEAAAVVAERRLARRLDAREDSRHVVLTSSRIVACRSRPDAAPRYARRLSPRPLGHDHENREAKVITRRIARKRPSLHCFAWPRRPRSGLPPRGATVARCTSRAGPTRGAQPT